MPTDAEIGRDLVAALLRFHQAEGAAVRAETVARDLGRQAVEARQAAQDANRAGAVAWRAVVRVALGPDATEDEVTHRSGTFGLRLDPSPTVTLSGANFSGVVLHPSNESAGGPLTFTLGDLP